MDWYSLIAVAAIVAQLLVLYGAISNYHYVSAKLGGRKASPYRPRTALIVPCKGIDARFTANMRSFFEQDYDNYHLLFVVGDEADPAYGALQALLQEQEGKKVRRSEGVGAGRVPKRDVSRLGSPPCACPSEGNHGGLPLPSSCQILVAGPSRSSSQKLHNLLHALKHVPADSEVLAFADSDICVRRDWLRHLIHPLYRAKRGVTTGYRWLVPTANSPATLAASALNAAVAQFLGGGPLNLAWGGSMAVRAEDFHRLRIQEIWSRTLSDDLSLSRAVKRAGLRITFVPDCLVPSFESFTWRRLYEFGRRQFLITRVYAPGAWWLGFLASLGSVLGLWGAAAAALYAGARHDGHAMLYAAVAGVFFAGQLTRAVLRQFTMAKTLSEHLPQLWPAALVDVFGCWLWSLLLLALMLSSAFGRTIRWRGIRYKLVSPTHIQIHD